MTFAGYRFSERNFMSMSQYLNARYDRGYSAGSSKEYYTLSFNQQIRALNMTAYLSYGHQTYWDRPATDTYNLSLARYFDLWGMKNLSFNLSAYRSKRSGESDDGMFASISIPWGNSGTLSYDSQYSQGRSSNTVGYSDRLGDHDSYRLNAGIGKDNSKTVSGYLSHQASIADINAAASYESGNYTSLGMSIDGGLTATTEGAALHRSGALGGTRMLVDVGGVSGVPIRGYGSSTYTNAFGKAVVTEVSSYYRNSVSVDLNELGDDVEATRSVVEGTLTEGAIGYRKFGILEGQKAMAILRLADGSSPPFGSTIVNLHNEQTGIIAEDGNVWLSGIKPDEKMQVKWDGEIRCSITLPSKLPVGNMLLPCK